MPEPEQEQQPEPFMSTCRRTDKCRMAVCAGGHAFRRRRRVLAQLGGIARPPELKASTPAHAKHLGWYLEFESRVTHSDSLLRLHRPHLLRLALRLLLPLLLQLILAGHLLRYLAFESRVATQDAGGPGDTAAPWWEDSYFEGATPPPQPAARPSPSSLPRLPGPLHPSPRPLPPPSPSRPAAHWPLTSRRRRRRRRRRELVGRDGLWPGLYHDRPFQHGGWVRGGGAFPLPTRPLAVLTCVRVRVPRRSLSGYDTYGGGGRFVSYNDSEAAGTGEPASSSAPAPESGGALAVASPSAGGPSGSRSHHSPCSKYGLFF